jgi:hypothetical protein
LEGLLKEGSDEKGLQTARFGFFHLLFDGVQPFHSHVGFHQGVAAHDLLEVVAIQCPLNCLVHSGAHSWIFTIANGIHQQLFE